MRKTFLSVALFLLCVFFVFGAGGQGEAGATSDTKDFGTINYVYRYRGEATDVADVIELIRQESGVTINPIWKDPEIDTFALMVAAGEDFDATRTEPMTTIFEYLPTVYSQVSNV